MSSAKLYRDQAAAARAAALVEPLPRRRQQHVLSAERWDEMAAYAEDVDTMAVTNAETKRPHNG